MAEGGNVQMVQEAYAAFERGDIEALLKGFDENSEWHVPGPSGVLPYAGARQGREQIKQYFELLNQHEEVLQFVPKVFIGEGERVAVFGRYQARVRATNRTYDTEWAHIFTIRDGKVAMFREFFDSAAAVEAYGSGGSQPAAAG